MTKTLLALLCVSAAACGGSDPGGTGLITVNEGATLELGGTTIEVPAHAVAADTEVTVSHGTLADFAPLANARDQVIVFEPYVSLTASATVIIDVGAPVPAPTDYAAVYQFGDGVWIGLDVSTIIDAQGKVHSAIPALGPTAVQILQPQ